MSAALAVDSSGDPLSIKVLANVDKNSVNIGDKITYTIEVETKKTVDVKFPDFGETLEAFSIRDFGSSDRGLFTRKTYAEWYILDTYETGKFTLPGIVIQYKEKEEKDWQEIISNSVEIEVKSILDGKNTEAAKLHDIKGPISYYNLKYLYLIIAVILLILIIATVIVFLKKRRAPKKENTPPRPAYEIAYEALRILENKDYIRTGKVQKHYFELSYIVRQYLENHFSLRAPEMTTEEFLSSLKSTEALQSEHKALLRDFLAHCDMVKFAKYHPGETEISSSFQSAKRLVDQTKESFGAVT